MKKLSPEQRDWLIEHIVSTFKFKQLDASINLTRLNHIVEIINQCTEDENDRT